LKVQDLERDGKKKTTLDMKSAIGRTKLESSSRRGRGGERRSSVKEETP